MERQAVRLVHVMPNKEIDELTGGRILHYRKERMKRKYDFGLNKSSCRTCRFELGNFLVYFVPTGIFVSRPHTGALKIRS
jgi:hypothetical protein